MFGISLADLQNFGIILLLVSAWCLITDLLITDAEKRVGHKMTGGVRAVIYVIGIPLTVCGFIIGILVMMMGGRR